MNKVTVTGKTVEDAISAGLLQLNLPRERVQINVVEQPTKGLFGLIGAKDAKVELSPIYNPVDDAKAFLEEVLLQMNLETSVERIDQADSYHFIISGPDIGIIIGRRGQTLDALQYIVNIVVNRDSPDHIRIILDAENFRERRKQTLIQLANRLSDRVTKTRKEVVLEPMSPLERKIIHSELQDNPHVKTLSKGEESNRRVVIMYRS